MLLPKLRCRHWSCCSLLLHLAWCYPSLVVLLAVLLVVVPASVLLCVLSSSIRCTISCVFGSFCCFSSWGFCCCCCCCWSGPFCCAVSCFAPAASLCSCCLASFCSSLSGSSSSSDLLLQVLGVSSPKLLRFSSCSLLLLLLPKFLEVKLPKLDSLLSRCASCWLKLSLWSSTNVLTHSCRQATITLSLVATSESLCLRLTCPSEKKAELETLLSEYILCKAGAPPWLEKLSASCWNKAGASPRPGGLGKLSAVPAGSIFARWAWKLAASKLSTSPGEVFRCSKGCYQKKAYGAP